MLINLKYHLAIKEINNNFNGSVIGNTEDDLVINWNGIQEISVADIQAKVSEMDTARETEAQAKINDKANGNQKLLDLGLTQAEATALTGYTPPVEE